MIGEVHGLAANLERLSGGAGSAYRVIWVDGTCQPTFANSLGISVDTLPGMAIYSPSKQRFATFTGKFLANDLKDFVLSVGKRGTAPLSDRPFLANECESLLSDMDDTVEDSIASDEMDDLLKEIQAEEEAEKKRRHDELEEEKLRNERKLLEESEKEKKK